jgi:hypothetical protein
MATAEQCSGQVSRAITRLNAGARQALLVRS